MKKLAASRDIDTYNPGNELRSRYPDWHLETDSTAQTDWVSFGNRTITIDPDLTPEDRAFALAFAVVLLDLDAVHAGVTIPHAVLEDAQGIAEMRLDARPPWEAGV